MAFGSGPVLLGTNVPGVGGGASELLAIDPATGTGTVVGSISGFPSISGLAWAPGGMLYAISHPAFGGTGELIRVDATTGAGTAVGPVGFASVAGLAAAPDGTLYTAVNTAATAGGPLLATLDPATGAATLVGALGFCVEALSFAPDGRLFAAVDTDGCFAAESLALVDPATGAGTIVGPFGYGDMNAMAFFPTGELYGADLFTGHLVRIDPAKGDAAPVGPTGFCCIAGLTWFPGSIRVSIDIKPGSWPNSINPRNGGTIAVAVLGDGAFDPARVDPASLTFGRTGDEPSLHRRAGRPNCEAEDVNRDGRSDLVCHFETQKTAFRAGDLEGILRGLTLDGIPLEGRDAVRIVP